VVVCLEQGADNSMIYTLFFIPDYQFQKVFFCVSLDNILLFFCGGPLVVEALGNCSVCPPPVKSGPEPDARDVAISVYVYIKLTNF